MSIRYMAALAALAAAYVLADSLGLTLATDLPVVTPIWPPTGLAIAALALFGRRLWPAVWAGALVTGFLATGELLPSLGIATGNAAEALLGAQFLRRLGGRRAFGSPRPFLAFLATAGLLAPLVSASVAMASLYVGGLLPLQRLPLIGITWWFGDALSAWVLVPFLVQAHGALHSRPRAPGPARLLEAAALAAYLITACLLTFAGVLPEPFNRLPLSFMTLPPLLWAALRFRKLGISTALVALAALTLWGTAQGFGQFSGLSPEWSFLLLQTFLGNAVVAFQILAQLVWARDRAVEDMRESKRTLDGIVRSIPGIIWESRGVPGEPGFRFNFVNAYAETLLGYAPSEWLADPGLWLSMVHPDDRGRLVAEAVQTFRGERRIPTEVRLVAKDGSLVDVEIRAVRLRDGAGRPVGLRGFAMDISDRHRAEERLRKVEEQLRQSQKMEAVGRLAGGVAHDFNNLLTAVNGYSELLLGSLEKGGRQWDHAREIRIAGERAAALVRKLLSFSRKEMVQPRILDLNALARGLEDSLRGLLGDAGRLVYSLDPALPPVKADPDQVTRVILDLASNAREAMGRDCVLTVATDAVRVGGDLTGFHLRPPPGAYARLRIADTGRGMGRETLEHLFEPFFTTKDKSKGTGLGLPAVYGILESLGGGIRVESVPGRGSTFLLYFPALASEAGPAFHQVDVPAQEEEAGRDGRR